MDWCSYFPDDLWYNCGVGAVFGVVCGAQGVSEALHAGGAFPPPFLSDSGTMPRVPVSGAGTARVLNPLFVSTLHASARSGAAHAAGGVGGGGGVDGVPSVEEGEGHGPRKELLQLIGQECTAAFSQWVPGPGEVSGADGRPKLSGHMLAWATPGCKVSPWCHLALKCVGVGKGNGWTKGLRVSQRLLQGGRRLPRCECAWL
jgi:hypothetical protein